MSNRQLSLSFLEMFHAGDVEQARALLENRPDMLTDHGYTAHPLLREFVDGNDGHCYKSSQMAIADLLIPTEVRRFRDTVVNDRVGEAQSLLGADPDLINAEFTAGRGIAQAIHHWISTDMCQLLLRAGANIHATTTVHHARETPLAMQLRFGTVEGVRFLLEQGADPNLGISPHMPSRSMDAMIGLLQEHGWEINAGSGRRSTMLHHDANHGHGARIRTWLKHGADPNIQDENGQTPLHIIAARGTGREAIRALVAAGASIHLKDDEGNTALDLARRAKRQTAASQLIEVAAMESP